MENQDITTEFTLRYRMPRPVARSYESVLFARTKADTDTRITWCAAITTRFIAAIHQSLYLSSYPSTPVNPPSENDYKGDLDETAYSQHPASRRPASMMMIAGMLRGGKGSWSLEDLTAAFTPLRWLAEYRLAVAENDYLRILLGSHMEYTVMPGNDMLSNSVFREGSVLLICPKTGDYTVLDPLVTWQRDPRESLGHIYLLRKLAGDTAYYIEEGVAGAPSMIRPLEGSPFSGNLAADNDVLSRIRMPELRFQDGKTINNSYHNYGIIWKGGTSNIFIADNLQTEKTCVLKTYENPGGSFDVNYTLFLNELKLARRIDHPALVRPGRSVSPACGTCMEMDYMEHGSLSDLLEYNGILPADQCVQYTMEILDFLTAAHSQGIAHNDIKPDNILFDRNGRVRIIDLGIAHKFLERNEAPSGGTVLGTPGFMAPELKPGVSPSPRSDLFSLGVVLFIMLTGEMPKPGDYAMDLKHVPVELALFLKQCLDAQPEKRFSSAHDALESLRDIRIEPRRAVTLDIEGTLVTNYAEKSPRPGLTEFIVYCMDNFDMIFIYTLLSAGEAREVFVSLSSKGHLPASFMDTYEYVEWQRGAKGSIKDLRKCKFPITQNAIVDDMQEMIPEDQQHRWIRVSDYSESRQYDRELPRAARDLSELFRRDSITEE